MTTLTDVVAEARTWTSTPWAHQQRTRGVAVDCIGLVIGVAKNLGLAAPDFDIRGYGRQPDGRLIRLCAEHMDPVARIDMRPGHILVLSIASDPQHVGILGDLRGGLSLIHSATNARPPRVIETRLMFANNLRFIAAFGLRGVA